MNLGNLSYLVSLLFLHSGLSSSVQSIFPFVPFTKIRRTILFPVEDMTILTAGQL